MDISLYIHIPFCVKKCGYCDFYSIPHDDILADNFVSALAKEWLIVKNDLGLKDPVIKTISFGGGTPSILSITQWQAIQTSLIGQLNVADDVEWTIECNPDSFTQEKTDFWRSIGVSRLTFGIQSLNDNELRYLGRPHTSEQALRALESPALAGFKSIGADLMYGLPHQTIESFRHSLDALFSAQIIRHLSAYELTICKNTPFGKAKHLPLPDEDRVVAMAHGLFKACREHGFDRYEISNFAKTGHRCRHNETYWNHSPYIGLGPAAHSYVHPKRWANVGDVKRYVALTNEGKRAVDFEETIDTTKLISEMIFLRLRTSDGLDAKKFFDMAGEPFYCGTRKQVLDGLLDDNFITHEGTHWTLTEEGMTIGDEASRRLM
ncbi:MAG TPA: radical SAM family heme chaperone HemW [Chitinivibrionales bacterium]|jgi:oxygen-independent coproporphyrinogen-3 oxidase|nr:radical SAM family heme chaperone HemW [Chitinivibrionales bacterium]